MTVTVFRIERLALHAHHGVHEAERTLGQRFFLDIVVTADVERALHTDEIDDSVHYGHVIKAATSTFTGRTFNLIEAAASAVADDLLSRFGKIVAVKVTVHKPSAPITAFVADISATVERRRND
jgi:7,8-dihydroneopterin aldolase/epimerase/oxygenase